MANKHLRNLILAAFFLALCLVLPQLVGRIPQVGSALLPMHLPVLICAFVCGWPYAATVGAIAPLLNFMISSRPPIMPTGTAMSFEMLTYGLVAGLLYMLLRRALPRTPLFASKPLLRDAVSVFVPLISAMVAGRVVWGVVRVILSGVGGEAFTWQLFISGAIITAIPGIIVQLVLVPAVVLALRKARVLSYA